MDTNKAMGLDSLKLEAFSGTDYNAWKRKVQLGLLNLKVYHVLIDEKPITSDGNAVVEWENADFYCKTFLLNSLSNNLADFYTKMGSAREIWVHLEQQYKDEEKRSQTFLMEKFFNLKFEDDKELLPQVKDLEVLALEIKHMGISVEDAWMVGAVIAKLPPSWKAMRAEIHRRKRRISLEDLRRYILVEDQQRCSIKAMVTDESRSTINAVHSSDHVGPCQHKNKKNKRKLDAPQNLKVQKKNFKKNASAEKPKHAGREFHCYNCGEVGHIAKYCKVPKVQNNKEENVANFLTGRNSVVA